MTTPQWLASLRASRALGPALRATRAPHREARQLPREAYGAEAFEIDRTILRASWLPVGHATELAEPGSFVALEVAGERALVVRGADLALHAYLDRCLHRGTPLTEGATGRLPRLEIVCPYHGLRYDLGGRAAEEGARALGVEARALPRVEVRELFGFVFARLSQGGAELSAADAPPWLARASTHALRLARRTRHEVGANWKLCVQNFQESHHFPSVHPGLERWTPAVRSESHLLGGAWLGGTMEIVAEAETVSLSGERNGRPFVAAEEDRPLVRDALLFPGWLTSLQPDYLLGYRVVPLAADRTSIVADVYVHAEAAQSTFADVFSFWDQTNAEDRAICERQHRGVTSASYEPGPYAPTEDGMHAFDALVAGQYLRVLEPDG